MPNVVLHLRSCADVAGLLALSLFAAACGDSDDSALRDQRDASAQQQPNHESPRAQNSVCPDCTTSSPGGETSDFGAQLACSAAYKLRKVTAAEAEALGYVVADVERAIEQPIDAAMTWQAAPASSGGSASGYEPETRIEGAFDVGSYSYGELDPNACDQAHCTLKDGTVVDTAGCGAYLYVNASGELATADGAIAARFPEQPVKVLTPGDRVEATVAAVADLGEATGSLRVDPPFPAPYGGSLVLSLEYVGDRIADGVLDVELFLEQSDDGSELRPYFEPIRASWGEPANADAHPLNAPDASVDASADASLN